MKRFDAGFDEFRSKQAARLIANPDFSGGDPMHATCNDMLGLSSQG